MATNNSKTIIGVIAVVAVVAIAAFVLNMPDRRSPTDKVGDAIGQLDNGVDNAARELEDRTPGERASDAIKDATD